MKKLKTTIALFLFAIISANLYAQNSSQLSIQGVLRNANGTAVENGKYDITFRLWDAPTNGNKIWEEEKIQVDVEGGIYSVILGDGATPLDADFTEQYFLGVSVEGGTELIPRAALTSSPYALSLIGNDNIFPNSGNVGVGSASPQNKLTVQRGNGILGLEAIEDANNTSTITTTANGLEFDAGGTDKTYTFNDGKVKMENGNVEIKNGDLLLNDGDIQLQQGAFIFYDNANAPSTLASLDFDTSENKLNLKNETGDIQITGTDIIMKGDLSIISSSINGVGGSMRVSADNNLNISNHIPDGDLVLTADGGRVKITSGLEVTGTIEYILGDYDAYGINGPGTGNHGNKPYWAQIYSDDYRGTLYMVDSDKRIKKDFKKSDAKEDLKTLKQLEITDYRHIDEVKKGTNYRKGLIAQQVVEVFPEAISHTKSYIPNIYTMSSEVRVSEENATISLSKPHGLSDNDMVKIITDDGEQKIEIKVVDKFTFDVSSKDMNIGKKVFVYGKEVDDFHSVDYDRVFTLAVSATQELARKVEALA